MQVCYRYDGSFPGFLCCIFESYAHREEPEEFLTEGDPTMTLWEERPVATSRERAGRVYRGLGAKISPAFQNLVERTFLTCLPDRERILWRLIRRGFQEGDRVRQDLSDPDMAKVTLALQKLWTEQDHLKGFVRFSQQGDMLVGEIEPKNRVLPLIGPHFAGRLSGEKLALYDRTHQEAFFYAQGSWTIVPVEDFHIGPAGEEELTWRRLWRRFFRTVSIEGRENPTCQATHLPLRYRHVMTEFWPTEGSERYPAADPRQEGEIVLLSEKKDGSRRSLPPM